MQGIAAAAPKARTAWVRGRPRPHPAEGGARDRGHPCPHVSTPPKAGPGTAGILPARLNPAEGGAWVRGRPARTFPQAAALPRRRGHRPPE